MQSETPPPKRLTEIQHQREFTWQVLIPLLAVILAALAVTVLSILFVGRDPAVSAKWAPIAIIFLVLPYLLAGIATIAILELFSIAVQKIRGIVPPYLALFSIRLDSISSSLSKIADRSADPFIQLNAWMAGLGRLIRFISSRNHTNKE